MRVARGLLAALPLTALMSATALGASLTGTVTGPDGKPFMGAFVAAENPQSRMTVNVLSDAQGRYHIDNLAGATYTVRVAAIGYASEPRGSVALAADAKALALANTIIGKGFHTKLPPPIARWFIMPFEHAENLDAQNRGVALFGTMGMHDMVHWAGVHRDIIAKFGRFPHRNKVLGRRSTPEELAFLAAGGFSG